MQLQQQRGTRLQLISGPPRTGDVLHRGFFLPARGLSSRQDLQPQDELLGDQGSNRTIAVSMILFSYLQIHHDIDHYPSFAWNSILLYFAQFVTYIHKMVVSNNGPSSLSVLLLTLASLLLHKADCQLNCSNYYSSLNLPENCNPSSLICNFDALTNSSLVQNDTLSGQYELCLDLSAFIVNIEGSDSASGPIYVNAKNIAFISGYTFVSEDDLVLVAEEGIVATNTTLSGGMIWMEALEVDLINATIDKQGEFTTDCDCNTKGTICQPPTYYFPFLYQKVEYPSPFNISRMNYTFQNWIFQDQKVNSAVIVASSSVDIFNSTIKISVIAVYAPLLTLTNSKLNTSGLGYSSGTGLGCGYFDEVLNQLLGCSGTGASHGGYGGNSGPQNCNLLVSSPPYDREMIPKYPGSGGGFFLKQLIEASSGGGVINIQTKYLTLENSDLVANGIGGIQGGGGGSGGSISIDFSQFSTSGPIMITANGGDGKSSGGGGRVRFFYHNWTYSVLQTSQSSNQPFMIKALGGGSCQSTLTCGENGSVIAAPCPPGYHLNLHNFACLACPIGYFQIDYGYEVCEPCMIKPANSEYTNLSASTKLSNYSSVCNFTCLSDYKLYNGRECLSSFYYLLAGVGGINLLICLVIIVTTVVVFLVIMLIRKISLGDRSGLQQNENMDIFKKRSYFKIEDIPFHEIRIYFEGSNTPNNPWRVSSYVERRLIRMEEYRTHMPFFQRLFKDLNEIGQYSRIIRWLLNILNIYYYPLSIFLASIFRENKANKMRNLLIARSRWLSESNIGIKIHVNQKFSIGCLEIFNYNRETLDFYIKNYFPIYFRIQKLIVGGYGIDFTDPLFKALCIQFEEKSNKNEKLEDYLIELNQKLRNSDQTLTIFKHLWKINSAWPSLQCHLWQPDNIVLGIDDRNEIDKNKDLFLVFSIEPKSSDISISLVQLNNFFSISSEVSQEHERVEFKGTKHFLYKCDLPNIFFDEISCIRHKYHLRQAMMEMEEKKTILWQIQNNFSEKYLSWILGTVSIILLLLNLLSFFLVIFMLVDSTNKVLLYAFIPSLVLFPFCEFLTIFLAFSLLISKGARVFAFNLFFAIFSIIKFFILTIIIFVITISNGFDDPILILLFFIWLFLLILDIVSLILLSMLHAHYSKNK